MCPPLPMPAGAHGGSRWNFLAMCSRTRDMPGGIFTPPPAPIASKRRKKPLPGEELINYW